MEENICSQFTWQEVQVSSAFCAFQHSVCQINILFLVWHNSTRLVSGHIQQGG